MFSIMVWELRCGEVVEPEVVVLVWESEMLGASEEDIIIVFSK